MQGTELGRSQIALGRPAGTKTSALGWGLDVHTVARSEVLRRWLAAKTETMKTESCGKHIVFVCQVFYPDGQSTSQLFSDLFRALDIGPHRVTVVTGYTAKKAGVVPPRYERFGQVEIRRAGIAMNYKRSLVFRALHYLFYLAGSTIELWKLRKCTLVFGVTNPPFVPAWLWMLRKVFLPAYQVMLLDVYPDGLVAVGGLSGNGWITRLWRAANRRALAGADRVLVLGRDMGELAEMVYGVSRTRIDYVPHWSSWSAVAPFPAERTRMFQELGLHGKFIVQYSGNMGLWHDIESIVRAAAKLRGNSNIHFLMIGDGMRRAQAQQLAQQLQLQNMTWLAFQPKESLNDSLSCCHVALISQREGLKGVAVPCKLYGILASGRPVLAMAPAGAEIDLVVREENCGRTIAPGDAEALALAVLELERNRALVVQMGHNAFKACQQKYTLSSAVNRFERIWGLSGK